MWHASGPFRSVTDKLLAHKIETYPGTSGTPIIKTENGKKYIIAVHIGADAFDPTNYAPRFNQ